MRGTAYGVREGADSAGGGGGDGAAGGGQAFRHCLLLLRPSSAGAFFPAWRWTCSGRRPPSAPASAAPDRSPKCIARPVAAAVGGPTVRVREALAAAVAAPSGIGENTASCGVWALPSACAPLARGWPRRRRRHGWPGAGASSAGRGRNAKSARWADALAKFRALEARVPGVARSSARLPGRLPHRRAGRGDLRHRPRRPRRRAGARVQAGTERRRRGLPRVRFTLWVGFSGPPSRPATASSSPSRPRPSSRRGGPATPPGSSRPASAPRCR